MDVSSHVKMATHMMLALIFLVLIAGSHWQSEKASSAGQ